MKTLRSHVCGDWYEASDGFATLHDPCTEEPIAQASTAGLDFEAAYRHARESGGPALREMTFARRGELLGAMSKALHAHRDELIDISLLNSGSTRRDAKFDLDGATGTLAFYGRLGTELGERHWMVDGEGTALGRSARFWGEHLLVPLAGVAVHINAFNFPTWGFAEKAACSILAGVPILTKPATSTSMITHRAIEILVEDDLLPDGILSFICGSTGSLLSQLGSSDVFSFTGSASTALFLRRGENLLAANTRVNLEADSLNAAVLGPDIETDSDTWDLFLADIEREMTQKTGQKCTAVRRIFVPADAVDRVQEALIDRLSEVVTGNPTDPSVSMGPLATAAQLADTIEGVRLLESVATRVHGTGDRIDGVGNDPGKGYMFGPTLLRTEDSRKAQAVHEHEVFGPVATLCPYDGSAQEAAELVALGGGSLVTSVYANDPSWVGEFVATGGSHSGRLYLGSDKMAAQAGGSGIALPQSIHGGPGRAGGGEELGGLRGLALYQQRVALQGSRRMLEEICQT